MKKPSLLALFVLLLSGPAAFAQTVKDANLYPTNLEENMYFKGYDAASRTIKGMHFEVLSDGDNSKWVTPAFTVKLYLYQQGKEPIFFKTFDEEGIYHMGKKEYNLDASLADVEAPAGTYRVGVFVNADKTVKENDADNAMLFRDAITLGKSSTNQQTNAFPPRPAMEEKEQEGGE